MGFLEGSFLGAQSGDVAEPGRQSGSPMSHASPNPTCDDRLCSSNVVETSSSCVTTAAVLEEEAVLGNTLSSFAFCEVAAAPLGNHGDPGPGGANSE